MSVLQVSTTSTRTFLQNQIAALESNGVNCDLIAGNAGAEDFRTNAHYLSQKIIGNPGYNTRYYAYMSSKLYSKLWKNVLSSDYDLIHVNSGLAAPLGILQPKRPLVISFWGSDVMGGYFNGKSSEMSRICARYADEVIVMSEEMKEHLTVDCHVIPHGVDLDLFRVINEKEAIDTVGWDEEKVNILFPYKRHREEKRYELAKKVVEEVNSSLLQEVKLQVVTEEPHHKIPYYMNAANALILTSKHEGSPNTIKEAMACNLPIISTDVGDVKERLRPVKNSFVCSTTPELVSALTDVIENGSRSNGRDFAKEFSIEKMAEDIIDVYSRVV